LMDVVRTITMVLVAVVVMFSVHWKMAVCSMIMLPLLTLSSFVYFRQVRKYFTASDEAEGALSTTLQENLTGVRVVRAFGQQRSEIDRFSARNADYRDKTYKLIKLLGFYWGFSDCAGYLQIACSVVAGVIFAAMGEFTLGNVTLFATYTSMLTWPVRQLGRILADLGKASVSLGRLDEILEAPLETEPGEALLTDMDGDIVFDHVCFGYDRYNDVLDDVSFTARRGETIAILGSTGSGKSSLVQLLQRLYLCTAGSITIGGVNINDIEHAHLRRNIGIVLQEPFLYSRTILENIRIVNPSASDEEVFAAARTASVHDVITEFEQGYDTIVGERGVTLSGGQQQRVAIARTLMQRARILIFDDSMSAVDTETDANIRRALHALRHDGITFLISHRITTLCEADRILVLDGGKLVQQGTHEELLQQEGLYSRIARIQDMAAEGGETA
ncbi:MAG: ABC transporter ATP-binding protein, partial [Clostridia bacterium]|nr:ABC transporter ATP-binding protein [Clostridia bacterium]